LNIVNRSAEDVDANHPTANNNLQASNETIGNSSASNSNLEQVKLSPKEHLRATISFRALVESDGQKLKKTGSDWKCRCPFHSDRTPSFSITDDDDHGKCFGCEWYGDIFKYVMDRTGCDFRTAFIHLASAGSLQGTKTKRPASTHFRKQELEYQFTEADLKEINHSTSRIINEAWLCEQIASSRKWKPETIQSLATNRHLGWGGDALEFIYKTGIKIRRWPGKEVRWLCGQPHLWRADFLSNAAEVYLAEGEPDAITLIDIGIEKVPDAVVVAAPSAGTFDPSWAPLFNGKTVTLCYDADPAGENGLQHAGALLAPVAHVKQWTPKEVLSW